VSPGLGARGGPSTAQQYSFASSSPLAAPASDFRTLARYDRPLTAGCGQKSAAYTCLLKHPPCTPAPAAVDFEIAVIFCYDLAGLGGLASIVLGAHISTSCSCNASSSRSNQQLQELPL
jgi:hypothetical protein